jgi:NhaA family Na+:H+ antiporter
MEHNLHSWVAFFIMPVFALANAGVSFGGDDAISLLHPVTLGVLLGLVVGKPIGILCAAWLAVKAGIADLPAGVSWKQVHGAGWLGGIGFTMSLFVAGLAFGESPLLATAKVGILGASALAAITGSLIVRKSLSQTVPVAVKPEML